MLLEDAILEQTENILTCELGKVAAATVTESLPTHSNPKAKLPSSLTKVPAKADENEIKEEIFRDLKVNWKRVAYIAGSIIETLPNNSAHGNNIISVDKS